jgi:hypothetical protein
MQAIIAQRLQMQKAVGVKSHSRLGLIQEVANGRREEVEMVVRALDCGHAQMPGEMAR